MTPVGDAKKCSTHVLGQSFKSHYQNAGVLKYIKLKVLTHITEKSEVRKYTTMTVVTYLCNLEYTTMTIVTYLCNLEYVTVISYRSECFSCCGEHLEALTTQQRNNQEGNALITLVNKCVLSSMSGSGQST